MANAGASHSTVLDDPPLLAFGIGCLCLLAMVPVTLGALAGYLTLGAAVPVLAVCAAVTVLSLVVA